MTKQFYAELTELIKKHKVTLMTGNPEMLLKSSKQFEGQLMFITKGEKVLSLRGGEGAQFKAHTTILLHKNRNKE